MKNIIQLILTTLIFSCSSKSEKITDLEKSNLKGNVHKVTCKLFIAENKNGYIIKKEIPKTENIDYVTLSIDEYNKSGMLNIHKEYVNQELINIEEYQYINNLLTSKKIYNSNKSELLVEIKYRYITDSIPNRTFILETPIGNKNIKEQILKEINENGYVINKTSNPFDIFSIKKTSYKYNDNNKVIEVNKYGHENNLYMKEIYQYGKKDIVELYKLVDSEDNLMDYEMLSDIKYDFKGNPTYIVTKDSIQPKMIYELEYEYY